MKHLSRLTVSGQNTDNMATTVHSRTVAEFNALPVRFCNWAEDGSTVSSLGAPASRRHLPAGSRRSKKATTCSTTGGRKEAQ